MIEIITDLEKLEEPAEALKFISDDGISKDEGLDIINKLAEAFTDNQAVYALAAKQIGINKRVFGIRFDNEIKYFINPIITKKTGLSVAPETFSSMPNKEILIGRPNEITVVYYTSEFKYEDNKLIGGAARIFDQMSQLLDGVLPSELGLVSDINEDGPLGELNEEEIAEVTEMWKKFIKIKLDAAEKEIKANKNLEKYYTSLKFTESVINGRTTVIQDEPNATAKPMNRAQRRALNKIKVPKTKE